MTDPSSLAAVAARVAFVVGAALLVSAPLRRRFPALDHLVLAGSLAAALLMPFLTALLPEWTVTLPAVVADGYGALGRGDPRIPGAAVGGGAPSPPGGGFGAWVGSIGALSAGAAIARVAHAVWALGALVLTARVLVGIRRVARLRRAALARGRTRTIAGNGRVRVVTSDAVEVPVVFGLFRPTILLPLEAEGWSRRDRRAVITHELAHVRRGDPWTRLMGALATALHWPNPLVWIAARRMRVAGERACDLAVLGAGVPAGGYAQLLVRLARRRGILGGGAAAAVASSAVGAALSERVEALLELSAGQDSVGQGSAAGRGGRPGPRARRASTTAAWLMAGGSVVTAVLAATVVPAHPVAPPPSAVLVPVPASVPGAVPYAERYGITVDLAERILRAARTERIEPSLGFGLVSVESGFDPARISPSGAMGLTQILPSSAAAIAPDADPRTLEHPDVNLRLGFRLLHGYLLRFSGDVERALLAYAIGPATVERLGAAGGAGEGAGGPPTEWGSGYPGLVLRAAAAGPATGP